MSGTSLNYLTTSNEAKAQKLLPADPEGGGAPDRCHSVASAASLRMYCSFTDNKMFSGLMSVWMIRHLLCK